MNEWTIRQAEPSDIDFIYATFLKSFHYDSWTKSIAKSIYFDNYKRVVDHILSNSEIKVACKKEDENVIFGYFIFDSNEGVAHYMFIKEQFRRFGIAKSLFENAFHADANVDCTHKTRMSLPIYRTKTNLVFNPFHLFIKE